MRKSYVRPEKINLSQINSIVSALELEGFCGLSLDSSELHVEFSEEKKKLTAAELKKLDIAISNYTYTLSVYEVRAIREPLLSEVDWRINKAEDLGEDTKQLRKYRQELRDITSQDLSELKWPEKPWEA